MTSDSSGATEPPLARRLARAALGVDPVLLPPEVVAKAKLCLIDFLSCALEAKDLPWSRQAVGIARQLPHAGARIVGTPTHTTPRMPPSSTPRLAAGWCGRTCTRAAARI
jgi:2-methylcitrate dehydratase PrpD